MACWLSVVASVACATARVSHEEFPVHVRVDADSASVALIRRDPPAASNIAGLPDPDTVICQVPCDTRLVLAPGGSLRLGGAGVSETEPLPLTPQHNDLAFQVKAGSPVARDLRTAGQVAAAISVPVILIAGLASSIPGRCNAPDGICRNAFGVYEEPPHNKTAGYVVLGAAAVGAAGLVMAILLGNSGMTTYIVEDHSAPVPPQP